MFTGLQDETAMKHSEEFISYKWQVTISNSWRSKVVQRELLCPGTEGGTDEVTNKYFDSKQNSW